MSKWQSLGKRIESCIISLNDAFGENLTTKQRQALSHSVQTGVTLKVAVEECASKIVKQEITAAHRSEVSKLESTVSSWCNSIEKALGVSHG